MDINQAIARINPVTARAFVMAARHVIDAMLIEAERVKQAQTPTTRDYSTAGLSREAPPGGWISQDELRSTTQKLAEAIVAEKWIEGALFAIRLLALIGGGV